MEREAGVPAREFVVREDDAGRRLDRVLRKLLPRASLARIYTGLRRGEARVDGKAREPQYRVCSGEQISLSGVLLAAVSPPEPAAGRESAEREVSALVLFRSEHIVVFNKPRGIPVHGRESLASMAHELLAEAAHPSLSFRPGPVHRIDRDTSGLVFFAVSLTGARVLSALLRNRACEKTYLALLEGALERSESWRDTLARDGERRRTVASEGGAEAAAEAAPLLHADGLTLARVRLESGRTHQIRAQAALHGHPLVGDRRYGGRGDPEGYLLHAARLRLPPGTPLSGVPLFTAPLPPESRRRLERHFGQAATDGALRLFRDEAASLEER